MKRFIAVLVCLFAFGIAAQAQTFKVLAQNEKEGWILYGLANNTAGYWQPFAVDSGAYYKTGAISVVGYDSLFVWARGTSATGTAKFHGSYFRDFSGLTSSSAIFDSSTTAAIDTTNIKLERIANTLAAKLTGENQVKFSVEGSIVATGGATTNPLDTKVYIYVFLKKTHRAW